MPRLFLAALFLFATAATAQVSDDLVDEYLTTTQYDRQLASFAGQFVPMFQMQAGQMPEAAREPYVSTFTQAFDADALTRHVRSYIARQGDEEQLRALMAWYEDPLVRDMNERMISSNDDPNAQIAIQMYGQSGQLGRHEVTPEQEAIADRYLQASGSVEGGLELYTSLIAGSNALNARLIGVEMPTDRATVRQMLEAQAPMIVGGMRGSILYAFRDVDPAQVEAFIARAEAPEARYGADLGSRAMAYAVEQALAGATDTFMADLERLEAAGELDLAAWRAQMQQQMQQQMQMQQDMQQMQDN